MLAGTERDSAIQAALNHAKVKSIQQELSSRGFIVDSAGALVFSIEGEKLVYLPAGESAGIVYETYLNQGYAVGLIREGEKTINLRLDRGVRHITGFDPKTRAKLLKSLRSNKQIKALEKTLKKQKQRIDWNKSVLLVETENNHATVGLAVQETNSAKAAWFGYRVEALMKGKKLVVQNVAAEACGGMAALEEVSTQPAGEAKLQTEHFGDPVPSGTINQDQICVSSWGYSYKCFSTTPAFGISGVTTSPLVTFVGKSLQTSFTIWNYSGKTMSGTATATTPFSVTPGSFTLAAGQPVQLTVTFNPNASGNFSGNAVKLTSGTVVQYVQLRAWTLTVTPARLDFAAFLGSSQNQTLTIKNDGPAPEPTGLDTNYTANTSTVTLNAPAPFSVGSSSITVSGQYSKHVTVSFAPTLAGSFSSSLRLISGSSSMDSPLTGNIYQVSINPAQPSLSAFVGGSVQQAVTLTNTGVIPVTFTASMAAPFSIVSPTSGITLGVNQSTTLTVQFSPTAPGTFTGSLRLTNGSSTKGFSVSGTTQAISISTSELIFPGVFLGNSPQQKVTVTNTGLTSVSFNVSTTAPFSIVSPTGAISLAPSQSADIIVRFSPTAAGTYGGSVKLIIGTAVQAIAVTGWTLTVSPASLVFDPVLLGFACSPTTDTDAIPPPGGSGSSSCISLPELTVIVKNDGPAPGSLDAINYGKSGSTTARLIGETVSFNLGSITALHADGTPAYSVSTTSCSLYGQYSCPVKVKFAPTASGIFSGTINLTSLKAGISSASAITVTGTAHKVSVTPLEVSFFRLIDTSGEKSVELKNEGITTIPVSLSLLNGSENGNIPFSVLSITTPTTFALAPGATSIVTLRFSPTESAEYNAAIALTYNEKPSALIPVKAKAMTVEEYCDLVLDTYNTNVEENDARPLLALPRTFKDALLRSSTRNQDAFLYGYKSLTCDDIKELLLLSEEDNPDLNDFVLGISPEQLNQALQAILEEYRRLKATGYPEKDIVNLLRQFMTDLVRNPTDPAYNDAWNKFFFKMQDLMKGGGWSAFMQLLADIGRAYAGFSGTAAIEAGLKKFIEELGKVGKHLLGFAIGYFVDVFLNFIIGGGNPSAVDQTVWNNATSAFLVAFFSIVHDYSPDPDKLARNLTNLANAGGMAVNAVAATIFAYGAFEADRPGDSVHKAISMSFFLFKLDSALVAFARKQLQDLWAVDHLENFLKAIAIAKSKGASAQELANLAAAFTTYVGLGEGGWTINTLPAALHFLNAYAGASQGTARVTHIIASMNVEGHKVTGVFHVESFLAAEKEEKILLSIVRDIAKELTKLTGNLSGTNTDLFIGIVAWGSSGNLGPGSSLYNNLKNIAESHGVPIYVVYVDSTGHVRGYCVGPRCDPNVLKKLAYDIFGVELGALLYPDSGETVPILLDPNSLVFPEPGSPTRPR
jgi:hypothetical protein